MSSSSGYKGLIVELHGYKCSVRKCRSVQEQCRASFLKVLKGFTITAMKGHIV
ncbi:12909_t:CDS:2 [Gigaspora rosea]|nr:12909_t:CDS:2 [Gigaspora rosea]